MNKIIIGVIIVLLVLAGVFFVLNNYIYHEKQADLSMYSAGTYRYQCADDMELSLSMTDDMTSVLVRPEGNTIKIGQTILSRVGDAHYEGDGLTLRGDGERISIVSDTFSTTCTPLPSDDLAPWNWGDVTP